MVNVEISSNITHHDRELFARIFNDVNSVNTFEKFWASGVWQRREVLLENLLILLNIQNNSGWLKTC